jgi:hypothetical protein
MINTGTEGNLEGQLKSSFDQMIKVIEEKCLKITENVTEENRIFRKEIQQLHNEVKEEKCLYQKMTENVKKENRALENEIQEWRKQNLDLTRKLEVLTEENIMLQNAIQQLHNEKLDLTNRLEVIIKSTIDRY